MVTLPFGRVKCFLAFRKMRRFDNGSGMSRKQKTRGSNRVTMAEVAREAGVSAITVSRALRQPDLVSPELMARILRACEILGYVRSHVASALASDRSHTILVLIPSLANLVFVDALVGIKEVLDARDYQMLIVVTGYDDPGAEERLLRKNLGYAPDGVLLTGTDQSEAVWRLLASQRIPAVHMMEVPQREECSWVGFSNYEAGRAVASHLIARGRRRIGIIAAQLDPRTMRRIEGCRAVLESQGLYDPALVIQTPERSTVGLGTELIDRLLNNAPDCDAVFLCNDDLAQGAVFQCMQRRITVPDRLAIVGFHDLPGSEWAATPLTTVRTPRTRIGQEAARMLIDRIEGRLDGPASLDLGFSIVRRASA